MTPAEALRILLDRAESRQWAGMDPYDGLLSTAGRLVTPLGPLPRFAVSQAVLRLPPVRSLLRPPPSQNPKAVALFLGASIRGRAALGAPVVSETSSELFATLESLAIRRGAASGWSYPFPWQSRSFWAPTGTPNAVATATAGWHLLEYADAQGSDMAYSLAGSAARFVARGLRTSHLGDDAQALSYTPADSTRVVNVSALGARLIVRALRSRSGAWVIPAGERAALQDLAYGLVRFVLGSQRADGSWPYAVDRGGGWEDSFHTGYVLESLLQVREHGMDVPREGLERGFDAYRRFFDSNGGARLGASPTTPYDAHSAAQGILTYAALAESGMESATTRRDAQALARKISDWALRELWLPERGYFAYRISRGRRDEREFTRWVQAWMALGMATSHTLGAGALAGAELQPASGAA